jgi:pimeloyl-ACP methyl ester carboxylesterase
MPNDPSKRPRNPRPEPPATAMWHTSSHEIVDPRWILKAGAGVLAFALLCSFVLICVVFSKTQWQLVLHPLRSVNSTPAALGLNFTEVRFGVDDSGQPQLDGWWIPSDLPSDPTVLMLHGGDGSMTDALQRARTLHDARLNVLLFDYRGFGLSGGQHPTEALMEADAASAFVYLTTTRGIPSGSILVYGSGIGGSLAARLCAEHKDISALILESPDGDFEARVQRDGRARLVPVRLLFHEQFPLAGPLRTLVTPKLLVTYTAASATLDRQQIADPKMTVELPLSPASNIRESLRRFLDTYVAQQPARLAPQQ